MDKEKENIVHSLIVIMSLSSSGWEFIGVWPSNISKGYYCLGKRKVSIEWLLNSNKKHLYKI